MNHEPKPAAQGAGDPEFASPAPPAATPDALYQAGLAHLREGRPLDAQVACLQALAIEADHADTMHLMGLLSLQGGRHDHAVEWLMRAIRKEPRAEYLATLGIALKQMGRRDEALQVFDKAVQLKPDDAELWKQLGGMLLVLDRADEALLSYQHALHLDPANFDAVHQSGVILHRLRRFDDALAQFDQCIASRPDHVPSLQLRARTLRGLKRYEDSLAQNLRAHALDPTDPFTCNNIGDALLFLDRCTEGLAWFDKALALRPEAAEILNNKALALRRLRRYDEAIAAYERVIALDPDNAQAAFDLSHMLLVTGRLDAGWAAREARWKLPAFSENYPRLPAPKWLGDEPVDGKTMLVYADEGLGDTIQFARYAPLLAERGARVILAVQDQLVPLLSGASGVSACVADSTRPLPPFDLHCPIMSLPLAFRTTLASIPSAEYLPPLPVARVRAWRDRLGPHDRLRVGLVWSGNPKQGDDRNRSMPLAKLVPLLGCDASFVSLQKDPRPGDKTLLAGLTGIVDPSADIADFVDTAALMSCLDLVITVCTSVAHLAGTLGCPTWVMLPYIGDWRWFADRDDSPWYPSVRLFRQDATRDYSPVVDRVRTELAAMISAFGPGKS